MSDAKGKSNYAYVGFCGSFFNNKTSFFSIPLNIVFYVVLSGLFARAAGRPGRVPDQPRLPKMLLCLTMR
ncbi:hypothetical protein [Akkermansia muciniphila]|uniref:hypothetical protein n=1 Tax=Akkermansia muciniphila TaxID=239935 RepID=UPI000B8E4C9B|nr:hypothetical protein [Akkermansia muciniphila]